MYEVKEYVDIKNHSTLKIGGQFRYFIEIEDKYHLQSIYDFAKKRNIPIFILGGGSNTVFSDGIINVVAIKIKIRGFEIIKEDDSYADIKAGAGEIWDEIVSRTVDMDLSGLESLSAIPGTVGASPVQNIGAYGSEVKDTVKNVEVFDIKSGDFLSILNKDCKFGYRDSIFKNEARGKYVITSVTYRLLKSMPIIPNYPGVLKYFEDRKIINPNLKQIREAIIYIRSEKLPNPKDIPNAGSFFKNPIVINKIAEKIKIEFPNAAFFKIDESHIKIPAGWLIENAGLKGKLFGNISVYNKNALVLINNGNASKDDLMKAKNEIIRVVEEKFGIILEQEPEII